MQFSTSILYLAFATLARVAFADDHLIIQVIVPDAEDLTNDDVEAIIEAKENIRRHARRSLRASTERRLDPEWCDRVCRGIPFPTCQVWQRQCYDHRRRALASSTEPEQRKLEEEYELIFVTGNECETQKEEVHEILEGVVANESQDIVESSFMSCFALRQVDTNRAAVPVAAPVAVPVAAPPVAAPVAVPVAAPVTAVPVETPVAVCEVTGFDLWNADTDSKIRSNMEDGSEICNGGGDYNFSIEAVANACIGSVSFRLQGPSEFSYAHTERFFPYLMFRNHGSDIRGYTGTLEDGDYTLTVLSSGEIMERTFFFKLHTC